MVLAVGHHHNGNEIQTFNSKQGTSLEDQANNKPNARFKTDTRPTRLSHPSTPERLC